MERWLTRNGWPFVIGNTGIPRVMRAYRDRKLGISDGNQKARLSQGPNRDAFPPGRKHAFKDFTSASARSVLVGSTNILTGGRKPSLPAKSETAKAGSTPSARRCARP
ncbi:DUF4224 domain-containing protein [Achromobacter dolens]|uniref:DUF4224 domain-containing protein n=1 Tax=Achromobacter dolens TaxID=1287738 RepID=UPI0034639084